MFISYLQRQTRLRGSSIIHNRKYSVTAVLLALAILLGATVAVVQMRSPSLEYYENEMWGFSLQYPSRRWELNENERVANDFSLQAKKGILQRDRARIYLIVDPLPQELPTESLTSAIEHSLVPDHVIRSVEVIQVSDVIDIGNHQVISATIAVPTLDIVEGSERNQMGVRQEGVYQKIDIYLLRNSRGQGMRVEVYKGRDEELNQQAAEIVESIRFVEE